MSKELQSEKNFILDPDEWPRWPILPLKKSDDNGQWREHGFLYNKSLQGPLLDHPLTLFKGSMYDLQSKILRDFPQEQFESVDKLLEAGWRVD